MGSIDGLAGANGIAPAASAEAIPSVARRLRWLFLIYAIPAIIFLSIAMAPFQVADEYAHFLRADQISRGGVLSKPISDVVDGAFIDFGHLYRTMWFHPEVKQTAALATEAAAIPLSRPPRDENFQNTLEYGPFLYIPQVIGIWIGRLAGTTPPMTLLIARLINGFAACAISFAALSICRRGLPLTFTTLLFAMTLSQLSSVSQDALIISLSIFVIALASRSIAEDKAGVGRFAAFAAIVAIATLARPAAFMLVCLAPAFVRWRDGSWIAKFGCSLAAFALIAYWLKRLTVLMPPTPSDWSVADQLHRIVSKPFILPTVMVRTFHDSAGWLLGTVVGRLGWLDTPMPRWYYPLAAIAFLSALLATRNPRPFVKPALIAAVTFFGLATAVCAALYTSWTPVGKATIDGLQGRYILPVLPLVGWLIPAYGGRVARPLRLAWLPVLLFPIATLATLPWVIMDRYYGSWSVMAASLKALYLT